MRYIDEIIVHCTATQAGVDIGAAEVRDYHVNHNGWRDIGYHYVVRLDGTIEAGRDEAEIGAHCKGHNNHSIGVCYVGGLDAEGNPKDTRTAAQKASLRRLLEELADRYDDATIHGHNEFAAKACPCFDVRTEYGVI